MNINEFVELYTNGPTEDVIGSHIKEGYIPYEKKIDIANVIIQAAYWRNEKMPDGSEVRVFHIDTPAKHMLKCMALLDLYTDIERTNKNIVEDFNLLNKYGIFDMIKEAINSYEIDEFEMVLRWVSDDVIQNEYEPHAFIQNQVIRFSTLFGTIIAPMLESLDLDKVQEVINGISNNE